MGKKDLGVHTEMIPSCVADLVETGVINGRRKTLHPGKIVGTFMLGDRRLYDLAHNNPSFCLMRGDYVNDPFVIARNDNMVSINTTIQVDLTGQAFSESVGFRMYSGSGGQNDTAEGAIHAKNGRSIICLYSTAKDGSISTITPSAYPGAAVTLSRNNIDYVVTEHGIAHIKGLSIRRRAERLISIAHPKFQDELRKAVRNEKII
jgi:acyl-CoA hydrolase